MTIEPFHKLKYRNYLNLANRTNLNRLNTYLNFVRYFFISLVIFDPQAILVTNFLNN